MFWRTYFTLLSCITYAAGWPSLATPDTIRELKIPAATVVYEDDRHILYAGVKDGGGQYANHVVAINPDSAEVMSQVFIGPGALHAALSKGGQYLYVTVEDGKRMKRIVTSTMQVDQDTTFGAGSATDLAVFPTSPDDVVVCLPESWPTWPYGQIVHFRNGTRLEATSLPNCNRVEVSPDGEVFYGFITSICPGEFTRWALKPGAFELLNTARDLLTGSLSELKYEDGLLYTSQGLVIDPEKLTLVRTFRGWTWAGGFFQNADGSVSVDTRQRHVFYVAALAGVCKLQMFDLESTLLLKTLNLPEVVGSPAWLTACGLGRLAFCTSGGQILLIDSPHFAPAATPPHLVVSQSHSPELARVGHPVEFKITVSNPGSTKAERVVLVDGRQLNAHFVSGSASQGSWIHDGPGPSFTLGDILPGEAAEVRIVVVPTTAGWLTNTSIVIGSGLDAADGKTISIERAEVQMGSWSGLDAQIEMTAADIAGQPLQPKLYVSVASGGSAYANSLVVLNPESLAVEEQLLVGSSPGDLALSRDGQVLHVVTQGGTTVETYSVRPWAQLNTFSLPPGKTVLSIDVSPQDPHLLLVGHSDRTVVVYKNGVALSNILTPAIAARFASQDLVFATDLVASPYYRASLGQDGFESIEAFTSQHYNYHFSAGTTIRCGGGYVYTSEGDVIDQATMQLLHQVPLESSFESVILPAPDENRCYIMNVTQKNTWQLLAYDRSCQSLIGQVWYLTMPAGNFDMGAAHPKGLVRWGNDGLAFGAGDRIHVVHGSRLSQPPDLPPTIKGGLALSAALLRLGEGASISMGSDVTASPACTYQWYRDGQPILGVTSPILYITNARLSDSGTYYFVASNQAGSVTSGDCVLYVYPRPLVGIEVNSHACEPSHAGSFRITRTGDLSEGLQVGFFVAGWAQLGLDYLDPERLVVIPAGAASADVTIIPLSDDMEEDPESVVLTLKSSSDYQLRRSSAAMLLHDEPDTDQDGMPDSFETTVALNVGDPRDASEDSDGDGQSNFSEYLAGTDLRDSASTLENLEISIVNGGVQLTFSSVANKPYSIQSSGTSPNGPWTKVREVYGNGSRYQTVYLGRTPATKRIFYRIVLSL